MCGHSFRKADRAVTIGLLYLIPIELSHEIQIESRSSHTSFPSNLKFEFICCIQFNWLQLSLIIAVAVDVIKQLHDSTVLESV